MWQPAGFPNAAIRRGLVAAFCAALIPVTSYADEATDQYTVAAGHYAHQRWQMAAEEFETFLRDYPQHELTGESQFFLGEVLLRLNRHADARAHYRQYIDAHGEERHARLARFRAGEAAYFAGQLDAAKVELARFLADHPDDPLGAYVLPYLGDIARKDGQWQPAVNYFRQASAQFPEGELRDECRFGLAQVLELQGRKEEAQRLYTLLVSAPGSQRADDARFHLGVLQSNQGRYEEALETLSAFDAKPDDNPRKATAILAQAGVLMKLGRIKEAKTRFAALVVDAEVGIDARYWLGVIQKEQKDWSTAGKTLLEAAADAADHPLESAIRFHAGDALFGAGDYPAAVEQFDRVIGSAAVDDPWFDDAHWGRIQAALASKDYSAVERRAATFGEKFPSSPLGAKVQRLLARSFLEQQQYEQAASVLRPLAEAAAPDSGNGEDRYLLALAMEGSGQYDEALAALEPIVETAGGRLRADALLAKGRVLMARRQFSEATESLADALAQQGKGEAGQQSRAHLIICLAQSGELQRARREYAAFLAMQPAKELAVSVTADLAAVALATRQWEWSAQLHGWLIAGDHSAESVRRGLHGLAWTQTQSGQLESAAETFDRLLQKSPPEPMAAEAALRRGRILEQLDKPEPALAMYETVIKSSQQTDEYPYALLAAAQLHDKLGNDARAAGLFEQFADRFPRHEQLPLDRALYQWAWVLDQLGQAEDAHEIFRRLYDDHPQSRFRGYAAYRLARNAFDEQDLGQAEALVGQALAADPSQTDLQRLLELRGHIAATLARRAAQDGDPEAARRRWDEVRETFTMLLVRCPESPKRTAAEFWIGESLYRQGRYDEAGQRFEPLIPRTRGRTESWMAMIPLRRAQVLAHEKKWGEAQLVASRIAADFPDFAQQYEADYLIGRCLASAADFDGARAAYRKVTGSPTGAGTQTAAQAQWMVGESYMHQENYEAAMRAYLRLELLYAYPTWQALALLQAGKCHERLGEWNEAAELYRRLLKVYPDTKGAAEADQRLHNLRQFSSARSRE